jgi:hypothetical protein
MIRPTTLRALPWIFGAAFLGMFIMLQLGRLIFGDEPVSIILRSDFANLWMGGRIIATGDFATLYHATAFDAAQNSQFGEAGGRLFSYPPTGFPIAWLVGQLPYPLALLTFYSLTAIAFAVAARRAGLMPGRSAWLVLLTPAVLQTLYMGQIAILLGALWLMVFALLDRRPLIAGALIGLFAMKPQWAVLLPIILILTGRWRVFAAATASTATILALSVWLYGTAPWIVFLSDVSARQFAFINGQAASFLYLSASTVTLVHSMTNSWAMAWALHGLVALWAGWIVWKAIRTGQSVMRIAMIAMTATFLILPYTLSYDLVVPAIAAWHVLDDTKSDRLSKLFAALGFAAPLIALLSKPIAIPVIPVLLIGLLIAQARQMAISDRAAPTDAGAMRSA